MTRADGLSCSILHVVCGLHNTRRETVPIEGQILRWWLGTGHVGKETTEITEKLLLQYFQLVTKPVLSGSAPPGSIARDPEYPLQDNYRSSIPYLDNIQVPHSTPLEELALF
ncbi:hypothetical protein J6590_039405 [Homalodisca vitripennis]|nr:hypothetical protein J6590_039405 [Homalodisca vitripennis]